MTRHRARSLANRATLIVAIPLAFQLVVLLALAGVVRIHVREQRLYDGALEAIAAAHRLVSLVTEIEASSTGFVLTRDGTSLDAYEAASRECVRQLAVLRGLVGAARLARIESTAGAVLGFHASIVGRARDGSGSDASRGIHATTGHARMRAFRAEVTTLLDSERRNVQEHRRMVHRWTAILATTVASGFAVNVFAAAAGILAFGRRISDRVQVLMENADRFEEGQPLHRMASGDDELAELDRRFHALAGALTRGRRQLERANQELESFTYTVSHDLRAPVRALNGYARMLQEDYGEALDEEGRRFLRVIRSEAERLGALIDDLLAFSRLGKTPLRRATVDMEELVRDVAAEVAPHADVHILPLPRASADRSMLRQTLVNLLANAVKFSAAKGKAVIEVGATSSGGEQTFWVRDRGVGFDMEYAGKLFGVFQRLHTESEFEGTGVGLAIVKGVVERHGGRVWAESKPGEGATFFFTLPAERRADE